jgi:hypothetical protein
VYASIILPVGLGLSAFLIVSDKWCGSGSLKAIIQRSARSKSVAVTLAAGLLARQTEMRLIRVAHRRATFSCITLVSLSIDKDPNLGDHTQSRNAETHNKTGHTGTRLNLGEKLRQDCKTFIHRFDSDRRLQLTLFSSTVKQLSPNHFVRLVTSIVCQLCASPLKTAFWTHVNIGFFGQNNGFECESPFVARDR